MTFPDELREEAARHTDPTAGMLVAAAWHLDRMTQRLATALGLPVEAVRVSEGLGAAPIAPGRQGRAVAADSGRVLQRPEPDAPHWYGDDHGWADRDDAHRVTFEGGAA